ncbi:MAG: hypothetical protein M1838_000960 [Thelocarpon superellum]|nr:MAG: hypothetical protein M1838_000960 [Thelocarpon superellum]
MRPPPKPKSPIATRQQRRPFPPLKYDKRLLLQVDELLKEASFVDTSRSLTQEDVSRSQLGMSKEQQDWVYAHLQLCRAPQIQTQRRVDGYIKHLEYMCVDPAALWKDTDGQDTLMSDGELGHLLDDFYDPPKSTEQAQGVITPRSLSSSATSKRSPTGPTITGVDPNNGHSPEEERYALLSLSRSEEPLNQRRSNREVIPNTINVFMVPRTPPQASLTPPTPHAAHPSVVIEELLVGEQVFSAADMTVGRPL